MNNLSTLVITTKSEQVIINQLLILTNIVTINLFK